MSNDRIPCNIYDGSNLKYNQQDTEYNLRNTESFCRLTRESRTDIGRGRVHKSNGLWILHLLVPENKIIWAIIVSSVEIFFPAH